LSSSVHKTHDCSLDSPSHRPVDSFELVSWNLASPNNNPFEFWVRARSVLLSEPLLLFFQESVGPLIWGWAGDSRVRKRRVRCAHARGGSVHKQPRSQRHCHRPHFHRRHVSGPLPGARKSGFMLEHFFHCSVFVHCLHFNFIF
jgi:hypothetical protein